MEAAREGERRRKFWLMIGTAAVAGAVLITAIVGVALSFSASENPTHVYKFTYYNNAGEKKSVEVEPRLFYEGLAQNYEFMLSEDCLVDEGLEAATILMKDKADAILLRVVAERLKAVEKTAGDSSKAEGIPDAPATEEGPVTPAPEGSFVTPAPLDTPDVSASKPAETEGTPAAPAATEEAKSVHVTKPAVKTKEPDAAANGAATNAVYVSQPAEVGALNESAGVTVTASASQSARRRRSPSASETESPTVRKIGSLIVSPAVPNAQPQLGLNGKQLLEDQLTKSVPAKEADGKKTATPPSTPERAVVAPEQKAASATDHSVAAPLGPEAAKSDGEGMPGYHELPMFVDSSSDDESTTAKSLRGGAPAENTLASEKQPEDVAGTVAGSDDESKTGSSGSEFEMLRKENE
ncbi:uncharacterized protein BcabD6B2_15660 [Babesia caballi]|uniref:Membrane protein, putative n=1 Tax=Babesia caballi TaxID=5871 RepID=A0AAV4LPU2_BABCB|nr:membrane protein, putative [Babesia caballi]